MKTWDELTKDEQHRISEWARKTIARFEEVEVDQATRTKVLEAIDQQSIEPFHQGSSLQAWDICYKVDGKYYQLIGAIGSDQFTVNEIIDHYPEGGPVEQTYPT